MTPDIPLPAPTRRTPIRAILSDIHGNLEALSAVLADIERCDADAIYNLGDTFGYGPNPLECLDLAMRMDVNLLGNFDQAVLLDPEQCGFCHAAEQSIIWTKSLLTTEWNDPSLRERRIAFVAAMSRRFSDGNALFVHGSARSPVTEYVFPEDIHNEKKMSQIGLMSGPLCFSGHTHQPGIFEECKPGKWEFNFPEEYERNGFPIEGRKLICNVGSVGQPRDGDERACYVLFDGLSIRFRRVEYDIDTTVRKIYDVPELDNFLGDRLWDGR